MIDEIQFLDDLFDTPYEDPDSYVFDPAEQERYWSTIHNEYADRCVADLAPDLAQMLGDNEKTQEALNYISHLDQHTPIEDSVTFIDEVALPLIAHLYNSGNGDAISKAQTGFFDPVIRALRNSPELYDQQEQVLTRLRFSFDNFSHECLESDDVFHFVSTFAILSFQEEGVDFVQAVYGNLLKNRQLLLKKAVKGPMKNKPTLADVVSRRTSTIPGVIVQDIALQEPSERLAGRLVDFALDAQPHVRDEDISVYTEVLNHFDISILMPRLLARLSDPNEKIRRHAAELLFRIELGAQQVVKDEVELYGTLFRLATDAGQRQLLERATVVRRFDPHGRWGVFDAEGDAFGYFNIAPEDLQQDSTEKQVIFNMDSLFAEACIRRADENDEDRKLREQVFKDYLTHYNNIIDGVYATTGVWLNSMELHEQAFFVYTYAQAEKDGNSEDIDYVIKKYGERALKTFITMQYGQSGKELVEFLGSNQIPEDLKEQVLQNYYEMSLHAGKVRTLFEYGELTGATHHLSAEVYEAFIRKSSEFYRAAMLVAQGKGGEVTMEQLLENMEAIKYTLDVLERFVTDDAAFELVQKPQVFKEYSLDGSRLIEDASCSFILYDKVTQDRIVLSVRPNQTSTTAKYKGGEARVNFKVQNSNANFETRIGLDLGDYEGQETKRVSLDIGVGKPDRASGVYPSHRVGAILGIVPGSEGGHNEGSFSIDSADVFAESAYALINYLENRYGVPVGRPQEQITTLAPSL